MSTLAHVLEAGGLATIALVSVRGQAERMAPPRALYCEFPLGRPLGRPRDPDFQHEVLDAAFDLLAATDPILETFPVSIDDESDTPAVCPLPPRIDDGVPAAVDEARGLRSAYDRAVDASGTTVVGRALGPNEVPEAVGAFVQVAEGTPWKEAGIPGRPLEVVMDIRAYYEEAAMALSNHVPAARAAESWFFDETEAGGVILAARQAMTDSGAGGTAYYMAPATR